jgi:Mg-chelatase subunit ChlD
MRFAFPLALIGLLALPYIYWLGWPRGAWGRGRARTALILRTLVLLLLVLALSGMQTVRPADELAVVFLVDVSDSMSESAIESARATINESLAHMRPDDRAAVITFGANAMVERPMGALAEIPQFEAAPSRLYTDLAEAIRLGMALYPPGAARRMVILSDGLANTGNAEEAARLAAAAGVEIVVVPLGSPPGDEVLVSNVDAPSRLNEGQRFDLDVTIQSTIETEAVLRVLGGGRVLHESLVDLHAGANRYAIPMTADQPGLTAFRVQVVPAGEDAYYQNNELWSFTQVVGPPRVLLVADDETEIDALEQALLAEGLLVDTTTGAGAPVDLASLSNYSSVVLANVPARSLGPRRMAMLQTYVRDLGGGLVMIGGPNAFGVGGYFQTPIEEALPVEMRLQDETRLPMMTVVYVIDKSGSMSETSVGGIPKVELAKEAIIRSVQLLTPMDRVGVIAFDETAMWVVPIQPVTDVGGIVERVSTIRADGGTDIYAGLLAVSQVLPDDPSTIRHVVLLTDGGASPEGIAPLVQELYDEHGITLSVIAIGQGYAPFIEELPEMAGGRFHYAYDADTIPEIFAEEVSLATRAYIMEEEFYPQLAGSSPILSGIESTPPLLGYVGATVKPTASLILSTPMGDPLLAAWQYGLGRSVAWTSDATARWGIYWVTWDDYSRFWAQAVQWTITEGVHQNVEVRIEPVGDESRIVLDARDESGDYLNDLEVEANIIAPDMTTQMVTLRQVAPGRYEGTFTPEDEGAYFVRLAGADSGDEAPAAIAETTGWVLAYSPEYRSLEGDPDYLAHIAELTGGRVIADSADVFAHTLAMEYGTRPIWPWLLLAATLLLPIDVAVRRLVITRQDLLVLAFWRRRQPVEERAPQMSALYRAKARAARQHPRAEEARPSPAPPPEEPAPGPAPSGRPAARPGTTERGTLASRLLEARRQRDSDETDE